MKTIVIAGASSAIAKETVASLRALGEDLRVIAYSRSQTGISGPDTVSITWDVTDPFPGLPDDVEQIDGVLYAPGTINLKPFKSLKPEQFAQDMQINFFGAIGLLQATLPLMKNGGGDIVFISSVAASAGMAYHSSIAAAKSALEGFARAMAAEYAAANIRFNSLALSLTDTPLASRLLSNDDKRASMDERHPLKRIGDPAEIANIAAHLLAGEYSWMTGETLHLDGGMGKLR